jgi:hypothetical protein
MAQMGNLDIELVLSAILIIVYVGIIFRQR